MEVILNILRSMEEQFNYQEFRERLSEQSQSFSSESKVNDEPSAWFDGLLSGRRN
jgi:hypothetical protein